MIQQESDNIWSVLGAGPHQGRLSPKVLSIDITSQREETICNLEITTNGRDQCVPLPLVLMIKVGSMDYKTVDDGQVACIRGVYQCRGLTIICGVHIASRCKKTINNIDVSFCTGPHQGRHLFFVFQLQVGSKGQENVHNVNVTVLRGDAQWTRCIGFVRVDVDSCFDQTIHNICVTLLDGPLDRFPRPRPVIGIGSVVEETVDDLQHSSLASRDERCETKPTMSSPLARASSTWAAVVAVRRSDIS